MVVIRERHPPKWIQHQRSHLGCKDFDTSVEAPSCHNYICRVSTHTYMHACNYNIHMYFTSMLKYHLFWNSKHKTYPSRENLENCTVYRGTTLRGRLGERSRRGDRSLERLRAGERSLDRLRSLSLSRLQTNNHSVTYTETPRWQ